MRTPGRATRLPDSRSPRETIRCSTMQPRELSSRAPTWVIRRAPRQQPATTGANPSYVPGWSAFLPRRGRTATSGWSNWLNDSCGWSQERDGLIDSLGEYPYIAHRQSITGVGVASELVTSPGTWLIARSLFIEVFPETRRQPVSTGARRGGIVREHSTVGRYGITGLRRPTNRGNRTWHVPPEP
jgi:hypothetical protein